jgi:hypothetical protein
MSAKLLFQFAQNILFDGLPMAVNGAGWLLQTLCVLIYEVVITVLFG